MWVQSYPTSPPELIRSNNVVMLMVLRLLFTQSFINSQRVMTS